MTVIRPERPNGTAILMVPGGSYERIALASDGGAIAHHFARLGFTVGALLYRLPYDGWSAGPDAPLQDAQRALRLLRRLSPGRVGVMGFSAGGHLAGSLAARFAERTYAKAADEDDAPARPDFAGLFFPVITMADPHAHGASRRNLIGAAPSAERIRRWSLEQSVPAQMPPTFISAAADDKVVPVENSLMMFSALRAAKVPSAMHIFDVGGHGFGSLTDTGGPGRFWPQLFLDWLGRQKL
jgi:acetyl esterase/lipase